MAQLGLGKIIQDTSNTMVRQIGGILFGLAFSILLARQLGPEGNGVYAMVLLLGLMLFTFARLGISPANVYFISRGDVPLDTAIRVTTILWGLLSLIGGLIGMLIVYFLGDRLFPGIPTEYLFLGILIFPIQLLQSFLVAFLQGVQDFRRFNLAMLVPSVLTLITALITVVWLQLDIFGALLAYGIGQAGGALVSWQSIRHHRPEDASTIKPADYAAELLGYGWKVHLSNISAFLNYRIDLLLVNLILNPAATGVYLVAVQLAERLWMLSSAASTVLLPRLSELHKDEATRKQLTPLISRWTLLITLLGAIVTALIIKPFILWIFGVDYQGAISVLILMLPGVVLSSFSRILANDIAARGRPELNLYVSVIMVVVNIVANIILIPRIGINGAALATTLSYSTNALAKIYIYSRISKNRWYIVLLPQKSDWQLVRQGIDRVKRRSAA